MSIITLTRSNFGFLLRKVLTPLICIIPKKNNLILFTAWFGEKYIDNTKYVYEYLLNDSKYNIYWITNNEEIYHQLSTKRYPVAKFLSLKGLILQLRAKVLFSTVQFADYNMWIVRKCIYIDLGHGNMIKDPGSILFDKRAQKVQNYYLRNLAYYAILPSTFAKKYYKKIVNVKDENIFISDFARNDVFVDATIREGKNLLVSSFASGRKTIVYMPTHRSDGNKPLNLEQVLPLDEIQLFCEQTNSVFIIKKHYYHRNEVINLDGYNRILDITSQTDIDPQVLLFQADVLITDYSSCFIDYLLLHRPIVFYQFDYDYYVNNERQLFIDFEAEHFAPIVKNKEDFVRVLSKINANGLKGFEEDRQRVTSVFFENPQQKNGRAGVVRIMESLLDN